MDVHQARIDAREGRLSVEQLLDLLEAQEHTIRRLTAEIQRLKQRLAPYEPEIRHETIPRSPLGNPTDAHYSLDSDEKRRRRRRRKSSTGRRPTHLKFADAQRCEDLYP